ncbi:MAG: IS21 family transposase [Bacillota bacterium]|jgi:transposase
MDQYDRIRHLHAVEGLSQRVIARTLGVSRNTVKRYLEGEIIPGDREPQTRSRPVTGPFREMIADILEQDKQEWKKQRHTAQRIYDRLRKEGYLGSYSSVRDMVRELRSKTEAYIPLEFEPGEAAQVDWGTAYVIIAGKRTKVQVFCMRLCYSQAIFVAVFPSQRYESLLEGHRMAFEFFGGVTRKVIYDNLKTAVKEGWGKHVTQEQQPFKLLKAHYAFESVFCNVGKGNEKGLVENLVCFARNNALVPVPKVNSWDDINCEITTYCKQYLEHQIWGKESNVGQMLAMEQPTLTRLPLTALECAIVRETKVNSMSLVRFDNNSYSVPVDLANHMVTIKGYPLRVEIWHKSELVEEYTRSYRQQQVFYRLEHYLPALEKKPRAVWNAAPVKRAGLEQQILDYGKNLSDKEFVKVLQLTVTYGRSLVLEAVTKADINNQYSFEAVRFYVLQKLNKTRPIPSRLDVMTAGLPVIQPVNLAVYDNLI